MQNNSRMECIQTGSKDSRAITMGTDPCCVFLGCTGTCQHVLRDAVLRKHYFSLLLFLLSVSPVIWGSDKNISPKNWADCIYGSHTSAKVSLGLVLGNHWKQTNLAIPSSHPASPSPAHQPLTLSWEDRKIPAGWAHAELPWFEAAGSYIALCHPQSMQGHFSH